MRSIIYKLVPGLYLNERRRIVQFVNNTKNEGNEPGISASDSLSTLLECDDDFYTDREVFSLSLEFHPHLAQQCDESDVPPVRYLKCLAGLPIQHLKRFLCSKFDIDPCNKKVDIEIIYEEEVLPSDFSLMDVAYCYQYKRVSFIYYFKYILIIFMLDKILSYSFFYIPVILCILPISISSQEAPLRLFYRILLYSDEQLIKAENKVFPTDSTLDKDSSTNLEHSGDSTQPTKIQEKSLNGDIATKSSSPFITPTPPTTTKLKSNKISSSKQVQSPDSTPSVKMTISSRPIESKKTVSKRSSLVEDYTLPTANDFKSLRSNDIRYSHSYAVTASTTNSPPSLSTSLVSTTKAKVKPLESVKEEKPIKCDIVVSIPHNQMQDEWDSKPLSQLKTASKKSPNPSSGSTNTSTFADDSNSMGISKKVRNVPKLKIELNSLKTKLIEKPKSADIRLDSLKIKHTKPRKFSLDEPQVSHDKVDLETYVKNIGLKPIEVQTTSIINTPTEIESIGKFTPNASPRSSCSSSTTSSSNGYLNVGGEISKSSSSHKKRKKKHSKEPRDSKRKKIHAEISSQTADESLKMKVKLTTPLNIKPSKFENKKSPMTEKSPDIMSFERSQKPAESLTNVVHDKSSKDGEKELNVPTTEKFKTSIDKPPKDPQKLKPLAIKTTSKDFDDDDDISMPDIATALTLSKSVTNLKDSKLPHSPPLPPSLFKTTPITFSTFSPNVDTVPKQKPLVTSTKPNKDKHIHPIRMKPLAPKPMPVTKPLSTPIKPPQFAVPNLPRLMPSNSSKFLTSTPSSIASSASKQMGNLLKRSVSLDEGKSSTGSLAKQTKLDKPHPITVSAYGSNLQVTRVEIPPTPTSSTAKATFEIPLYSPLSASYNPKCSFSVGSSTSGVRSLPCSIKCGSNVGPSNKTQVFTTCSAVKKQEQHLTSVTSPTNSSGISFSAKKTSPVMGPPLPLPKLNIVVPTAVKSPPLSSVVPAISNKSNPSTAGIASLGMLNSRPSLSKTSTTLHKTEKNSDLTNIKNGNGSTEKPTSSLRQFRLPSRESGQDILDLSSAHKTTNGLQTADKSAINATVNIPASPTTTAGSSLGMALTKIKNNMTNSVSSQHESKPNPLDLKPNSDDLQNLHLLSESATAREKIAINSPTSSTSVSSLYEKPKINQNSLVRQQNASVRSIPNPSALAFRNLQPSNNIPMVTIAAPLVSILNNDAEKPLLSKQASTSQSPIHANPRSPNFTTSSVSPSRTTSATTSLSTKRHTSIDQVAASLNIRATAAAAAEATAKSNLKQLDEMAVVTSTSSLSETGGGCKLKQQIKQETPEQTTPTTVSPATVVPSMPPSSTVHSAVASSSEIVEIKKEPEDRFNETSLSDEQREVKALFATASNTSSTSSTLPVSSSLVSKVENLVTSVINVSTPTSSLLATSSAGF